MKRKSSSNYYSESQRFLSAKWRETKHINKLSWNEWKKTSEHKRYSLDFNTDWKRARTDPGAAPARPASPEPGPSHRRSPTPEPVPVDEPAALPPDLEFNSDDWDNMLARLEQAGARSPAEAMDVSENTSRGTGGGGPHANLSGGGSPLVTLSRSRNSEAMKFSFHKTRTMWSYAYPNTQFDRATTRAKLCDWFSLPLSLIPVDFLPFYLTPGEFDNLPYHTIATKCWCKVKVLGVRTAFNTGTSDTGVATAEYVPILLRSIGLNNRIDIENLCVESVSDKFVPTFKAFDSDDYINKFYKHYTSSVNCVPVSNKHFACMYWNKEKNTTPPTDNYKPHIGKMYRLDKNVDRILLNSAIGETVVDYEYNIKDGRLTGFKQSSPPWYDYTALYTGCNWMSIGNLTYNKASGMIVTPDKSLPIQTVQKPSYYQTLGMMFPFNDLNSPCKPSIQPQVHIGMQAIPRLNPSTESTDFINACVYYEVECGLECYSDYDSVWTWGMPQVHHINQQFTAASGKKYAQPTRIFSGGNHVIGDIDWTPWVVAAARNDLPRFRHLVESKKKQQVEEFEEINIADLNM